MATLLVVDGDGRCRRKVARLLRQVPALEVIEAGTARDALARLHGAAPDALLACARLADADLMQLIQTAERHDPVVPVIVLTSPGHEHSTFAALRNGAAAYVAKSNLDAELVEVVQEVLAAGQIERAQAGSVAAERCLVEGRLRFEIDNDPARVAAVIGHVDRDLCELGLGDETMRMRVCVALQEALMNAIIHGNLEISSKLRLKSQPAYMALAERRRHEKPYCDRRVQMTVEQTPDQIVYTIRDAGPGFDIGGIPDCTDPANLERPCGRGLTLIRAFMDEVRHNRRGNEIRMVLRRTRPEGKNGKSESRRGRSRRRTNQATVTKSQ